MANDKILVVGGGSIGKRHIRNASSLFPDHKIHCVTSSHVNSPEISIYTDEIFKTLSDALEQHSYKFAFVASPATYHLQHLAAITSHGVPTIVEKPLTNNVESLRTHFPPSEAKLPLIDVAYNLRFHPALNHLKGIIENGHLGEIYTVLVNVGQYLPDWRSNSDYRKGVSAQKSLGGGALRELSHELDYIGWLFGTTESVYCRTNTSETLGLDVEDRVCAILNNSGNITINLNMDFLQRKPKRTCHVIASEGTAILDLINSEVVFLTSDDSSNLNFKHPNFDMNQTYIDELSNFYEAVNGCSNLAVGFAAAKSTVKLIEAMEQSSRTRKEVSIE